jgi:hypothetical protein
MIIAAVDFDTQSSLQMFDVVIKRATEAQQAVVVCRLEGYFTGFCIQAVPLLPGATSGVFERVYGNNSRQ